MMQFKCVIAFCLLAVGCSALPDCHMREVEICASSMAVFAKPMQYGENADYEKELEQRCDMVDDLFSCFGNYTQDCFKEEQAELVEYAMRGGRKMKEALCSPDSVMREEYMKHIPCLQSMMRAQERPCLNDLKAGFEAIINSKASKRKALGCCVMNRFRDCYGQEIEEQCGLDARLYVKKTYRIMFSRLPEYMCADFTPQSGLCDDMPPVGARMTGVKSRYKLLSHFMYLLKSRE